MDVFLPVVYTNVPQFQSTGVFYRNMYYPIFFFSNTTYPSELHRGQEHICRRETCSELGIVSEHEELTFVTGNRIRGLLIAIAELCYLCRKYHVTCQA